MRISITIIATIFTCVVHGQNGGSTKITIFKPEDAPTSQTTPADAAVDRNAIKWNYSLISRGVFLINYEAYLNKKLTAEVGLGITYRDFIFEVTKESIYNSEGFSMTPNVGYALEGGLRFYPKDFDNFEGIYISPILSYRTYSFTKSSSSSSWSSTSSTFKPGYNFFDIQIKFGYQYESIFDWDVLGDFYIGFAYRNASLSHFKPVPTTNSSGFQTTTYIQVKESIAFPQALIG